MFSKGVGLSEFEAFLLVVCQTLLGRVHFVAVRALFTVLLCVGRIRYEIRARFLLLLSL